MSLWLPFLLRTLGLRASGVPSRSMPMCFWDPGMSRFFSEVMSLSEGRGNFTVDLVCLIGSSSMGNILAVLHFD